MTRITTLLFTLLRRPEANNQEAPLVLTGAVLLGLAAPFTTYWIWITGQPAAALWVGLTLWLTILVAGTAFWLLALGRQS
ncbi:hypothetical protein ACFQ4C_10565 [Larkinella insperata]|uniref:Uncharacterized protein n=1 Tax=Larkinella insperata TaxID=332158 RepID=A0ABW3QID5_9BACT|nr:hypothetical protein [Larkinella insperata]